MSQAAGTSSASLVPFCPGSELDAKNPLPNCIFHPWAYPKQAAKFSGTAAVTKPPTRVGKTWNEEFTVTVHYTVPYKTLCAPSGAQPSLFPCQVLGYDASGKPAVAFGINGAYVRGRKTFEGVNPNGVSANCPADSGTCVETFEMNTYSIWGHFVLVVGMNLEYFVPLSWGGPGGDLGAAGFETAISVTFPKLPGSSPVKSIPD